MLDLKSLENRINKSLSEETETSLSKWINKKRNPKRSIRKIMYWAWQYKWDMSMYRKYGK